MKMRLILIFSALFLSFHSYSQKTDFSYYLPASHLGFEQGKIVSFLMPACFKHFDSTLYIIYSDSSKSSKNFDHVRLINLNTESLITEYDILLQDSYRMDFVANSSGLYFLHDGNLYRLFKNKLKLIFKDIDFRYMEPLSTTKILFYDLLARHPLDGDSKLKLAVFDCARNKITKKVKRNFQGYSVTNIINKWVTTFNKKVVIINPFEFNFLYLDENLNFQRETRLDSLKKIYGITHLVQRMDREKQIADSLILLNEKKLGPEISNYYSKSSVQNRINLIRDSTNYIEKAFEYNDSMLIFSVYKQGYNLDYRDIYFYNTHTSQVTQSLIKWSVSSKDTVAHTEDYFTIDFINSNLITPFFYKGNVYSFLRWCGDINSYKGDRKVVEKKEFRCTIKNGWQWAIGKFSY